MKGCCVKHLKKAFQKYLKGKKGSVPAAPNPHIKITAVFMSTKLRWFEPILEARFKKKKPLPASCKKLLCSPYVNFTLCIMWTIISKPIKCHLNAVVFASCDKQVRISIWNLFTTNFTGTVMKERLSNITYRMKISNLGNSKGVTWR